MIARLGCSLLGGYTGVLGILVHRQRDDLAALSVPWGLLVGFGLVWLVASAAGHIVELGAAWAAAGWALSLLVLQWGRDVLVGSDSIGWSFMAGSLLLFVVAGWRSAHRSSGSTS